MALIEQIGRYKVIEVLGKGGMATVYRCHDDRFKRDVAVKMLHQYYLDDEKLMARFRQEARIIAALEHHAIVPVYDYGYHEGQPYIVMRLMKGGSLKDRIEGSPPSLEETVTILTRICSALDRAHMNNIVHRDLKPGNILFDQDGMAYLADFGIARLTEATQTTSIVGSPNYMSPEQARGLALDGRTDIYQMGVVLFEMLTGNIPFLGETTDSVLYQHVHEPVPLLSELAPQIPPKCDAIIARALAKSKEDRFDTASEMAESFRQAIAEAEKREALALAEIFPPPRAEISRQKRAQIVSQPTRAMVGPKAQAADATELMSAASPSAHGTTEYALPETAERKSGRRAGLVWVLLLLALAAAVIGGMAFLNNDNSDTGAGTGAPPASGGESGEAIGATDREEALNTAALLPVATPSNPDLFALDAVTLGQVGGGSGRLAYAAKRGGGETDIYVNTPDGGEIRLTDNPNSDFRPIWSPDGRQILYHSFLGNWELFSMNADGSEQINLTNNPADDSFPQWSPDGARIVFHSNRDGLYNIYAMDRDGSNVERLTNNGRNNYGPFWSPDGRQIAFHQEVDGRMQIVVMNADGSEQKQLTFEQGDSRFAVWSPNGDKIAFDTNREGVTHIYVMNPDGSEPTRLTEGETHNFFYPAWSPNGEWVAFHGAEVGGENRDLWIVRADGTELQALTSSSDEERMPTWQPAAN